MIAKIKQAIEDNKTDKLIDYSIKEEMIPVFTVTIKFKGKYDMNILEKHITHEHELKRLVENIKSELKKPQYED
jgi:hypothetical protein